MNGSEVLKQTMHCSIKFKTIQKIEIYSLEDLRISQLELAFLKGKKWMVLVVGVFLSIIIKQEGLACMRVN